MPAGRHARALLAGLVLAGALAPPPFDTGGSARADAVVDHVDRGDGHHVAHDRLVRVEVPDARSVSTEAAVPQRRGDRAEGPRGSVLEARCRARRAITRLRIRRAPHDPDDP